MTPKKSTKDKPSNILIGNDYSFSDITAFIIGVVLALIFSVTIFYLLFPN